MRWNQTPAHFSSAQTITSQNLIKFKTKTKNTLQFCRAVNLCYAEFSQLRVHRWPFKYHFPIVFTTVLQIAGFDSTLHCPASHWTVCSSQLAVAFHLFSPSGARPKIPWTSSTHHKQVTDERAHICLVLAAKSCQGWRGVTCGLYVMSFMFSES